MCVSFQRNYQPRTADSLTRDASASKNENEDSLCFLFQERNSPKTQHWPFRLKSEQVSLIKWGEESSSWTVPALFCFRQCRLLEEKGFLWYVHLSRRDKKLIFWVGRCQCQWEREGLERLPSPGPAPHHHPLLLNPHPTSKEKVSVTDGQLDQITKACAARGIFGHFSHMWGLGANHRGAKAMYTNVKVLWVKVNCTKFEHERAETLLQWVLKCKNFLK